ncbi:uncharacterized protein [Procambarus clarkii]|uniref:uncharacterized protein n=1 Tax=Procambarus clarkii TaxID=6728 RepID=UPI003742455B
MNAEDPQDTFSKTYKGTESLMACKHSDVHGKDEQELENPILDAQVDASSKYEQNSGTIGDEIQFDAPAGPEQNPGLSIANICIGDFSNSKKDLVTININDSYSTETFSCKQKFGSSDGILPHIIVSSPLDTTFTTKAKQDFTTKSQSIIVADDCKHIGSAMINVASVSIKQSSINVMPLAVPGGGSPLVSSKLQNNDHDKASSCPKVKIKKTGSVVVRTIAPRTIRNISAKCSSSKNGACDEPSGTILITREMNEGRTNGSSKVRGFPTAQIANKPLQIKLKVNDRLNLSTLDNEPSTNQEHVIKNSSHSICNDDVLISRQLDDDGDNNITGVTRRMTNSKTPSDIVDSHSEIQDGSSHNCGFCRCRLKRAEGNTSLALDKPLPSSLLDPISLLQCLGISSPLYASGITKNNLSIVVCQQCCTLVSDGDVVYQQLLSVISQMRELWPTNDSEILMVPVDSNGSDNALKANYESQSLKKTPVQSSQNVYKSCKSILPKPNMSKENDSLTSYVDGKVHKVKFKQELSNNKMRICGFCGMDLYGEGDWNLHQSAVHRVEKKWRLFNLQPTLKTLLAKEIEQVSMREREDSRQNWKSENINTRKCPACSRTFSVSEELVQHLRNYHNMVIDEEFLCHISEDANVMDWSNSTETHMVENSIKLKTEGMWDDHTGVQNSESDAVFGCTLTDNDTPVCEGLEEQGIITTVKGEITNINTEDDALSVPDDSQNYIGANENKEFSIQVFKKENSKIDCSTEFCCRVCAESFTSLVDLEKHECLEHSESVKVNKHKIGEECKVQTTFSGIDSLPMILRAKTKVRCKLCNQICDSPEDLNNHIDTCHENSVVILEDDGYGGVIDHRLELSKALGSDLEHVQKGSEAPKLQLNASKKKTEKKKKIVCNLCGDIFLNRLLLVRHKRSSHGDVYGVGGVNGLVMVECDLCGRRLHGIGSLRLHLSKVHNRSQKPPLKHRCKMCIFHSKTRNQLEKHMQEKHGLSVLPPVECKVCGKMYSAKYIDIHIANMHENQKKFSCNFCAMKFNIKSSLKCHISYEHANNKWSCDMCHIEFEKYHQLRQHRIYVHSTQVYSCPQCGKTFKRKSDMTEHGKRRHMEKIMSECTYCAKAYSDRKKLRSHLIKKHGVAWEDTLSKSYARHQRENNCLRKHQPRNSKIVSQSLTYNGETVGIEIVPSQYDLEDSGEYIHSEEEQQGDDRREVHQVQHTTQKQEKIITTYAGASIEMMESQEKFKVVQVTEGSKNMTDMANICYIVLEETHT